MSTHKSGNGISLLCCETEKKLRTFKLPFDKSLTNRRSRLKTRLGSQGSPTWARIFLYSHSIFWLFCHSLFLIRIVWGPPYSFLEIKMHLITGLKKLSRFNAYTFIVSLFVRPRLTVPPSNWIRSLLLRKCFAPIPTCWITESLLHSSCTLVLVGERETHRQYKCWMETLCMPGCACVCVFKWGRRE